MLPGAFSCAVPYALAMPSPEQCHRVAQPLQSLVPKPPQHVLARPTTTPAPTPPPDLIPAARSRPHGLSSGPSSPVYPRPAKISVGFGRALLYPQTTGNCYRLSAFSRRQPSTPVALTHNSAPPNTLEFCRQKSRWPAPATARRQNTTHRTPGSHRLGLQ